jgi:hypothetical protein
MAVQLIVQYFGETINFLYITLYPELTALAPVLDNSLSKVLGQAQGLPFLGTDYVRVKVKKGNRLVMAEKGVGPVLTFAFLLSPFQLRHQTVQLPVVRSVFKRFGWKQYWVEKRKQQQQHENDTKNEKAIDLCV